MKLSNKANKYNSKLGARRVQCRIDQKVAEDIYVVSDFQGNVIGRVHSDDINVYAITCELDESPSALSNCPRCVSSPLAPSL